MSGRGRGRVVDEGGRSEAPARGTSSPGSYFVRALEDQDAGGGGGDGLLSRSGGRGISRSPVVSSESSLRLGDFGSFLRRSLAVADDEDTSSDVGIFSRNDGSCLYGNAPLAADLTTSTHGSADSSLVNPDEMEGNGSHIPLATPQDFGDCEFPAEAKDAILDYFSARSEDQPVLGSVVSETVTSQSGATNSVGDVEDDEGEGGDDGEEEQPNTSIGNPADDGHFNAIEHFFSTPCCLRRCNLEFKKDLVISSRDCSKSNDYRCADHVNHLHLLLLGQLSALTMDDSDVSASTKSSKESESSRTTYMFRGWEVCKRFFLFANNCGERKLRSLKLQLRTSGMDPNMHGRQGMRPSNATDSERIEDFRKFLINFCDVHALVLPGRLPYHQADNPDLRILPSSLTKVAVHKEYESACSNPLTYQMFVRMWNTFFPSIVIQKPRTDLCPECYKNTITLGKLHGLSEEGKLSLMEKSRQHLVKVMVERKNYLDATRRLPIPITLGKSQQCSYKGSMHYSFDFAQQIFLPYDSQQVGPLYFLTPYKVALFGVACEPAGKFVLYLIPESAASVGKGSNIVISLLHHFLENFGLGEEELLLHADNCAGQNKNNYFLQYATWRTCAGLHRKVKISFLPVGHTKFAPDLYFGCVKRAYRRSSVHSLEDLKNAILLSCSKTITPYLVANEEGAMFAKIFDWQKFFKDMKAERIPGLLENYHFECSSEMPGLLLYNKNIDSPQSRVQIFPNTSFSGNCYFPTEIVVTGLSPERQRYLFEKIREYVREECRDILCLEPPEVAPSVPSTSTQRVQAIAATEDTTGDLETEIDQTGSIVKTKRVNKCGYCGIEGHTNRISKSKIPLCPKRRQDEDK